MDTVALSWLVLAAVSPLAGLLLVGSLFACHSCRTRCKTTDVFLAGVSSVQLVSVGCLLAWAVVHLLIEDALPSPACVFFTWIFVALRLLQLTIVASMAVDRALALRCPYRYRLSVRCNQVRYHLVVLAVIVSCIGVAAVFAKEPTEVDPFCSVLPTQWEFSFVVFFVALLSVLLLTQLAVAFYVCFVFCCRRKTQTPTILSRTYDARWTTVFAVSLTSYALNHLPYLVVTIYMVFVYKLSSPWLENGCAWLALAEALFLPLVLGLADKNHSAAWLRILCVRSQEGDGQSFGTSVGDDSGETFRYVDELSESKVMPRSIFGNSANGARPVQLFQPGIKPNSCLGLFTQQEKIPWRSLLKHQEAFYGTSGTMSSESALVGVGGCRGGGGGGSGKDEFTDPGNITFGKCFSQCRDDNYTTLSQRSCTEMSDESDGSVGSIAADDDFEFHDTRPSVTIPSPGIFQQFQDSSRNTGSSRATTASVGSTWRSNNFSSRTYRVFPGKPARFRSRLENNRSTSYSTNDLDKIGQHEKEEVEMSDQFAIHQNESTLSKVRICRTLSEGNMENCGCHELDAGRSAAPLQISIVQRVQLSPAENNMHVGIVPAIRNGSGLLVSKDFFHCCDRNRIDKMSPSQPNGCSENNSLKEVLLVLDRTKIAYLDKGDQYWHYILKDNEPEVKKVFITEYL